MGLIQSCCFPNTELDETPDRATMREMQAKAADQRLREEEKRGIKDPEGVKRKQAKKDQLEHRQLEHQETGASGDQLRWQVG